MVPVRPTMPDGALRAELRLDSDALRGARCRFAGGPEEHRRAAALIHDAYVERGLIAPSPQRLYLGAGASRADLAVLVLANDDVLLGTLTLIPDRAEGLPADQLYPAEMNALRAGGPTRRIAEVGMLAVAEWARGTGAALVLSIAMMRLVRGLALTDLVIQLHPSSEAYYRAVMQFERRGVMRRYPGLSERAETIFMHHDIPTFDLRARDTFGEAPLLSNPYHLLARHPLPLDDLSSAALDTSRAARAAWLAALPADTGEAPSGTPHV